MKKIFILVFAFGLLSCEKEQSDNETDYQVIVPENPQPKGNRMFGINLSESKDGFETSYAKLQEAGTDMVELNIPWNAIETGKGQYVDPYGILAASEFYGRDNLKICFSIAVINTVAWEVPAYLSDTAPHSSEFITAFNNMIDWFMANVPENVTVPGISVGNEVDLVLSTEDEWKQYIGFYEAAAYHIKTNYPEIIVGAKTTVMNGLFSDEKSKVIELNQHSDVVMLNYYPQNEKFEVKNPETVHTDFQAIVDIFPNQKIWMTEIGYQSGANHCNSSEKKQAQFFHNMFIAWDNHKDKIEYILIDWLHDQSDETLAEWKEYYGNDVALVEYLGTLGLRNFDGTDKPAWLQVLEEIKARGW